MSLLTILVVFSTISFLYFGISCFSTEYMRDEFRRYGLTRYIEVVGVLQILGAIGLIIGYLYLPMLGLISALGLCLLMICGFGVRLKIRDSVLLASPSIIYAFVTGYIAFSLY